MGQSVGDAEEGEISNSASVEEIINKPKDVLVSDNSKVSSSNEQRRENPRVWTMQDLYKYQMSHNYASGLYNLAWAQAVQNKSLDDVYSNNTINNNNKPDNGANNGGEGNEPVKDKVVIDLSSGEDDEREEGELEEGEIDSNASDSDLNKLEYDLKDKNNSKALEERIDVIREALESVITSDSDESFDMVCSRIKDSLDSLWEVILEDWGSNIDDLVTLAFRAINTLNIMFDSMRQNQKEQNKDSLLRLFHHVTRQNPPLFSTKQIKEIECMMKSLESSAPLPSLEDTDKQTKIENNKEDKKAMNFNNLEKISFRGRGMSLPLLDLHKDHDEDSLPSPTRDAPSIAPLATRVSEDIVSSYLETDAFKAISTYQKKFSNTSFDMTDLPSPTPSEDNDDKIDDTRGENYSFSVFGTSVKTVDTPSLPQINDSSSSAMDISCSIVGTSVEPANTPILPQLNIYSSCAMDISSSQAANSMRNKVPVKSSAKSRDPRLRFANKDTVASRVSNVDSDGPLLKKQKNNPTVTGAAVNSSSTVGNTVNVISNGSNNLAVNNSSDTVVPLESILKDIAKNPALWVNLIKTEQQKSVDPVTNSIHLSSSSSIMGTIPPVNVTVQKPAEILQMTPPVALTDESEKIRMKPRDPRRALLNNKVQKLGNSNHINTSAPISSSQDIRVGLNSCNQTDRNVPPLENFKVPDITRQFTKNLKNIADIVSNPVNDKIGNISSSEEVSVTASKNAWGEVEHLFEGLDEKQKAAFHTERARRINEQKKMFSARKLCLVLDLDHTLLNSAKFVEVDPVHDEILRKKEEQDREKPHRHLFRFPHMGMWTKLRPGIWNFLEKASQLFEMHLYTMGNKLYASEMAKLLDPKGILFSGRVISRGDDDENGDISKSKDLEGVLGMESGVIIIDDSVRVWPHNKLNLIVVERYIYFPCSRRQFGLLGPSLLEIDHDERPEAGTLASSLAVIERIHENFFGHGSLDEADVRNILGSEQRKILNGCRIVFSRIFPVGEVAPHLHPLWQTAEQFGAQCTNHIDDQVTHVVANSLGTDKVNWALSTGRFVVHPGWVEASALLYRRANEQDFAVKS